MFLSLRGKSISVCLLAGLLNLFLQPARTPSVQAAPAVTLQGEEALEALHQRGEPEHKVHSPDSINSISPCPQSGGTRRSRN